MITVKAADLLNQAFGIHGCVLGNKIIDGRGQNLRFVRVIDLKSMELSLQNQAA